MNKLSRYLISFVLIALTLSCLGQKIDYSTIAEMQKVTTLVPRYKMFKTENSVILLKLDTRTGKAWMTQFRSGSTKSLEIPISDTGLDYESMSWNGRFDMCATNNIYKFIIIDTYTGKTYMLQWNIEDDKRFVEPIVD
ncbi:MAG: hypothetical protein IJU33_05525 [Bacteroidales bacterium]|nr:hypothetical protein [Bacteroidales bacterium]